MARESKKRKKNHQVGRREYKVRIIEKPLLLSRASATSAPRTAVTTTTTTTPPTMSNPAITTTTWPSTTSTTVNLFVYNPSNTLKHHTFPIPKYPTKLPDHGKGLIHHHHLLIGHQKTIAIEQTEKRERR